MTTTNPPRTKYLVKSQKDQILLRPGQHIGDTTNKSTEIVVAHGSNDSTYFKNIKMNHNPALIHIFYEILTNAQDNYYKSADTTHPLKNIKVTIDKETNEVSVYNDGNWIPVVIHEWDASEKKPDGKSDFYEPELIFGHLNSSGNYDDTKTKRRGAGLHGQGAKLTNIFSTYFCVEVFDPEHKLLYKQEFRDNLTTIGDPVIKKKAGSTGWVKITYKADFDRFGKLTGYNSNHIKRMKKLCIDCAMTIPKAKVEFNGETFKVPTLSNYVGYYLPDATSINSLSFKTIDSEVVFLEKPDYDAAVPSVVAFVNGIMTPMGGVHVEKWKKAIYDPLLEKIKKKFTSGKGKNVSTLSIGPKTIDKYFMLFVRCNLENPHFGGQTKDKLNSPEPTVLVDSNTINKVLKWKFMDDIEELANQSKMRQLSKNDGTSASSVNIKDAVDANWAGTSKGAGCTLFIVEGLSAKTFAVRGIGKIKNGTNMYGILPVRGKVLNVRDAPIEKIADNAEITNIRKMLGLKMDVDYSVAENRKKLRYGCVRVLTDADVDGDHIKGLVINFFDFFYPKLLDCGYVAGLRTPIIKITYGTGRSKKVKDFYYQTEYDNWCRNNPDVKFTAKYYKGLGTSENAEIDLVFKNPRYVKYNTDDRSKNAVTLAFSDSRADDRKKWLADFEDREYSYDVDETGEENVQIADFIDNELIRFSMYDNVRSLPSIIDGLKPSHRKILWYVLTKTSANGSDKKVESLGGAIAEASAYHHGPDSLKGCIVKMAQQFIGSNNIAYLAPKGQFGTRMAGGKDAAQFRYIFTKMAEITRLIFRKEDDPVLDYLEDEGIPIEPRFYVPVVPMVLVNGMEGMGTGWSTKSPNFNVRDVIECVKMWIETTNGAPSEAFTKKCNGLIPWYNGFKGTTVQTALNKYEHRGKWNMVPRYENCYEITELPIGMWTNDYHELLKALKTGDTGSKSSKKGGYSSAKVGDLKAELKARKLKTGGKKSELIDRLKDDDKAKNQSSKSITSKSDVIVKKWEWHGDDENILYRVWTTGPKITPDDPRFKLTTTESTSNMVGFDAASKIKKYKKIADIVNDFCVTRLKLYEKRKQAQLAAARTRSKELKSKIEFIGRILGDIQIMKQSESQLFEYFERDSFDFYRKDDSYRYLTDIPIRSVTADKYEALKKELDKLRADYKLIKNTSEVDVWKHELTELERELNK